MINKLVKSCITFSFFSCIFEKCFESPIIQFLSPFIFNGFKNCKKILIFLFC